MKIDVLNAGFVQYVEHMGTDLSVVNAARVSFDKESDWATSHPTNPDGTIDYTTIAGTHLSDRDTKLIHYLAKHKHWCYDDQTEILTERGWVDFPSLKDTDAVAQVNKDTMEMSFVVPSKVHRCDFDGSMYLAESETVNYCVTPGHKMLYQKRTAEGYGPQVETTSDDAYGVPHKRFRNTAVLTQGGNGSWEEGWLIGFLLGDGFKINHITVGCNLKKKKKIDALRSALVGRNYKESIRADGAVCFIIKMNSDFLSGCPDKTIPPIGGKSSEYIQGLFGGLVDADGSKKHGGWAFTSSSRGLFDGMSMLASLCGYWMTEGAPRHLNNPNHNTNYRGIIRCRDYGNIRSEHESVIPYKGKVYCVTVPTGFVLVRRKGKQIVCGNTPFGQVNLKLRIKMPIFVARQLMRSNIGIVWNEVSRRYVDTPPEAYEPDVWRSRPTGSMKQGSGDEEIQVDVCDGEHLELMLGYYNTMISDGIAPEQARSFLPQGVYTEVIGNFTLAALARVCALREDSHAQWEIQEFARAMGEIAKEYFPVSWEALTGGKE